MKMLVVFGLMTICLFAAVNWFLLPMYPVAHEFLKPLTVWSALGLSGCLTIVALIFGKGH